MQIAFGALVPDADTFDADAVIDKTERARFVANSDAALGRGLGKHLDEAGAATHGLDGQPAPELELAVDLEGLAAVDRNETHTLVAHPAERIEASGDQELDQIRVGAVLRHARHVVEKLLLGIGAEIGGRDLLFGQIRHQRPDVIDAVVNDPNRSGGEPAIAAGFILRRRFQHQHRRALFLRCQRGAKGRVAATHDDDIRIQLRHSRPL